MGAKSFVLLCILLGATSQAAFCQAIGSKAPNKQFISSWNLPANVNELSDFRLPKGSGKVVLLDWFGAF